MEADEDAASEKKTDNEVGDVTSLLSGSDGADDEEINRVNNKVRVSVRPFPHYKLILSHFLEIMFLK